MCAVPDSPAPHTTPLKGKNPLAGVDVLCSISPMRRLLLLAPVLAAMTGCGDGLYYQTRYIPTDIDSSFTVESLTWGGDKEVIELPAAPPDINAEHRPRIDCQYPYQKFKPTPVVAMKKEAIRSQDGGENLKVATMSDYQRPTGPTVPLTGPKLAAYANSPYAIGVTHTAFKVDVGGNDTRPRSTTGAGTDTIDPIKVEGGLNSKNYNPYCCGDGFGTGTTNQ